MVGPERSGTSVHVDPLATSAWNTLIHGQKRWVLFPPHVPKSVVKGRDLVRDDEDDEPIHYFMYILPRIKRKAAAACFCGGDQPVGSDYRDFACYEFTQNPGETVFVPNGWWHAVLNLTHTVAITQNFCSSRNFDEVWMKTRVGRKRLAWKWLCQLDVRYPHLAHRARSMNYRDRFLMKYDPAVIAMREAQRRQSDEESDRSSNNDSSTDEEDCKEEKREDKVPEVASAAKKKVIVPFVQTPPRVEYMDRSWKRCKVVEDASKNETRPVSPA